MHARIIAANWKMHKNLEEGLQLAQQIISQLQSHTKQAMKIILLPSFIHLEGIYKLITVSQSSTLYLGAQNCHHAYAGAFTGEVSVGMLRSVGAQYVLVGHSERRQYGGEDNSLLATKVSAVLTHDLQPIFCCGETWQTREESLHFNFVCQQLTESLFHLNAQEIAKIIIAYEPIWAIGSGKIPSLAQVKDMHKAIRKTLSKQYTVQIAAAIPILYGGSCTAQNAAQLLACSGVDGALIGGASLEAHTFMGIINALTNS